ncbi:hypothetical protein BSKO_04844 [Bryopsis sp. KO-2023]|nr:hypothetical protein BSKO_04844 [Bryopsis sp. KO-2023]
MATLVLPIPQTVIRCQNERGLSTAARIASRRGVRSLERGVGKERGLRPIKSRKTNVACNSAATTLTSEWAQKSISLPAFKRGCHVVTRHFVDEVPEIKDFQVGLANLFIMHTSASLTINENASPDVPLDLNDTLDRMVPEGNVYRHLDEGYDDMPAHVKSSLMGPSLTIPINGGRLALGTWQGIYLNEHRNYGGSRTVVVTIQGRKKN